jgi:hypothetical protein
MQVYNFTGMVAIGFFVTVIGTSAQESHDHVKGMEVPMKHTEKMLPKSTLKPAQGASVKIISPKTGDVIKGDSVPLEFKMTKGKIGEHVHAYVDGEMAGMFKSAKGTLNGLKPGQHILELRVATGDHNTELDAADKVTFTTK